MGKNLNRRSFLGVAGAALTTGFLAVCGGGSSEGGEASGAARPLPPAMPAATWASCSTPT
ncbi:MAG: hypothetical protein IJM67_05025 [Atopobiaceae bacterium]|nr:hypothetical protein [Atopobiaceae bacterium]MBQ6650597.1 hypothetical protein [Atopobiaceae bacterium]MBR3384591.1 hypothetical protein [Atopobiaceae bacterium]